MARIRETTFACPFWAAKNKQVAPSCKLEWNGNKSYCFVSWTNKLTADLTSRQWEKTRSPAVFLFIATNCGSWRHGAFGVKHARPIRLPRNGTTGFYFVSQLWKRKRLLVLWHSSMELRLVLNCVRTKHETRKRARWMVCVFLSNNQQGHDVSYPRGEYTGSVNITDSTVTIVSHSYLYEPFTGMMKFADSIYTIDIEALHFRLSMVHYLHLVVDVCSAIYQL